MGHSPMMPVPPSLSSGNLKRELFDDGDPQRRWERSPLPFTLQGRKIFLIVSTTSVRLRIEQTRLVSVHGYFSSLWIEPQGA